MRSIKEITVELERAIEREVLATRARRDAQEAASAAGLEEQEASQETRLRIAELDDAVANARSDNPK